MNETSAQKTFLSFFKQLLYHGLESFGKYYSTYLGVCYSNEDPENLNRLQLVIPTVTGNSPYEYWAWPKHNYAGKGYGMQLLPRRGDTVRVEFENGHPRAPVWMHSHFGRDEKPDELDLKDKNCFWFITPNGHRVVINDTKNYLIVQDNQGNQVKLDSTGITQVVADGKLIILGTTPTDQAVLGNKLFDLLTELIDTLKSAQTLTAIGPQRFLPDTQIELALIKTKLLTILSQTVKLK